MNGSLLNAYGMGAFPTVLAVGLCLQQLQMQGLFMIESLKIQQKQHHIIMKSFPFDLLIASVMTHSFKTCEPSDLLDC